MSMKTHRRAWRRMMEDKTASITMKRFYKVDEWLSRKERSEANCVFWVDGEWKRISGAGLIHKGRKP